MGWRFVLQDRADNQEISLKICLASTLTQIITCRTTCRRKARPDVQEEGSGSNATPGDADQRLDL